MKRLQNSILCLFISMILLACAHTPTVEELKSADYGPYPENYEEIVKEGMASQLFDPYSAQYTFQGYPFAGFLTMPFKDTVFGWCGYVSINAKNRFGGYVGAKKFFYVIKNNRLLVCDEASTLNR